MGKNSEENFPSPSLGKERSEGLVMEGPRAPASHLGLPWPRMGWLSSPLTAPRSVAPTSECIWKSSSSSFSIAARAGTPGWGPPGLALQPALARPTPATFWPRHAPSPRLRTTTSLGSPALQSSAFPASPRGGSDEGAGALT